MVWLDGFTLPNYFVVVDRIAREYHALWKKHGDDMHLNRENILESVIPKVLRQIRPPVDVPENEKDILEVVQPLIEHAFEMPGPPSKLKVGSKRWIQQKIDDDEYTFPETVQYVAIMNHYIAMGISQGDELGYPIMSDEDIVPTGKLYKISTSRVGRPRAKTPDMTFPFMRSGAVKEAVEKMRNKNIQPVVIHAANMPVGQMSHDWNNKAEVL